MTQNDMVTFLMPDGTKVSNDPRFGLEEALQEQLDATPYSGDAGISLTDQEAQVDNIVTPAPQSGQPGVGEKAVAEDPMDYIPPVGTGMNTDPEAVKLAKEAGGSPVSTSVKDPEPVDSNAKVLKAREAEAARQEALKKAQDKLGEGEPGDPSVPYSDWTAPQLKLEVARRNADRGDDAQLDMTGMTKKSQVAELLEQDDAAGDGSQA
jgi:hypothetical protein